MSGLEALPTPALVLDERVLEHNTRRMAERMSALGVSLRPHLETVSSWTSGIA